MPQAAPFGIDTSASADHLCYGVALGYLKVEVFVAGSFPAVAATELPEIGFVTSSAAEGAVIVVLDLQPNLMQTADFAVVQAPCFGVIYASDAG